MTFVRRAAIVLAACALALSASQARAQGQGSDLRAIHHARDMTWHYQRLLGHPLRPYGATAEKSPSHAYRMWVLHLWHRHWMLAKRRYNHVRQSWYGVPPDHVRIFLCIHPRESVDWYADTGNGFYGGLQFSAQTWTSVVDSAPVPLPAMANEATPQQQVYAANYLIYAMGAIYSTQWPNTSPGCV